MGNGSGATRRSASRRNNSNLSPEKRRASARRRRQRQREREVRRQRLMLIGVIAAAVVVCVIIWRVNSLVKEAGTNTVSGSVVSSSSIGGENSDKTNESSTKETDPVIKAPEAEDGTADAGIMTLTDLRSGCAEGWNEDENGKWYAPSSGTCYYCGWMTIGKNTYHFDENGYAATGWTAISYRDGRYFTEDGVYVPDADASNFICLTFDDGPSPKTEQILDILAEYDAKATFFVVGRQIERYGEMIPKIVEAGHQIGNHSYGHVYMGEADEETVISQFSQVDALLEEYGVYANLVRFPYGDYTSELVALTGRSNILWDNDSRDWESDTAEEALAITLENLEAGNIILMHDMYDVTVEMLPQLLDIIRERGYECVTMSEMIAAKGYTERSGVTFFGFKQSNFERGRVDDT